MHLPAIVYLTLAAIALLCSALLTLQAYEFRRFACSRGRRRDAPPPAGKVLLVCPCRGAEPRLAENLRSLLEQDHGNYRLVLVVDSSLDPACSVIRRLLADSPRADARLIVAGAARESGQKVHNLLAATADLSADIRYLAFADSDARTSRDWLRQLVQRLDMPGVVAATGYRWLVSARPGWPNSLVHALDAAVASLVGPSRHHLVWGGSWAVRRDAFDASRLRAAWRGTLSDDLVASGVLGQLGRVEFEPAALVASSIDFDTRGMFEFVGRQLTIGRFYAPVFWGFSTVAACLQQAVFWTGAALAPVAWQSLTWQSDKWTLLAALAALAMYGMQAFRGWLREDAGRRLLPGAAAQAASQRRVAVWGGPLVGLLQCWGLLRAILADRIVWRGIEYELLAGGQMRRVQPPPVAAAPVAVRQAA